MKRIKELISAVTTKYPDDQFFADFDSLCTISKAKKAHYLAYERALSALDAESWCVLKTKALQHYMDHRPGQLKQGFFNQLNEAFAYRYLISAGASAVRFIPEAESRTPDLSYILGGAQMHCEVKSLGISNDEIERRNRGRAYDLSVHSQLSEGFIKKFCDAVSDAREQIASLGSEGLVYLMVNLDDIALDHYSIYRKQLIHTAIVNGYDNLTIKFCILGNKRICIKSKSTRIC